MSHVRAQIRDAVATLVSGVATVYKSRAYPIAEASLPVALVYCNTEEVEPTDFGKLERRLQVVVEIVVQASVFDATVDSLIASTEAALGSDLTLGGLALHCLLTQIDVTVSVEGSAPIARARMTYVAHYRTTFSDPETPL